MEIKEIQQTAEELGYRLRQSQLALVQDRIESEMFFNDDSNIQQDYKEAWSSVFNDVLLQDNDIQKGDWIRYPKALHYAQVIDTPVYNTDFRGFDYRVRFADGHETSIMDSDKPVKKVSGIANLKEGDIISFYTSTNANRAKHVRRIQEHSLGLVVPFKHNNGDVLELGKLVDIEKADIYEAIFNEDHHKYDRVVASSFMDARKKLEEQNPDYQVTKLVNINNDESLTRHLDQRFTEGKEHNMFSDHKLNGIDYQKGFEYKPVEKYSGLDEWLNYSFLKEEENVALKHEDSNMVYIQDKRNGISFTQTKMRLKDDVISKLRASEDNCVKFLTKYYEEYMLDFNKKKNQSNNLSI